MQTFDLSEAVLEPEYGIAVGRWTQYRCDEDLPFDAMWCVVPPHSHTVVDAHPEVELAIVLGGAPTFDVDGRRVDAATGSAVLLRPGERHVIHADAEPVRILSIYWLPERAKEAVHAE